MTPVITTAPAAAAHLADAAAATVLAYALHTPAGTTFPAAAAAISRPVTWILAQLAPIRAVQDLGPDLRTGHTRYQIAHPIVTEVTLIAGALVALAEHDWAQNDYEDELGRVDITGALRLAAGVHPRDLPDDPHVLDALYTAEDCLAAALGHDPTQLDAGEQVAAWQDHPDRTLDQVRALLIDVVTGTGR